MAWPSQMFQLFHETASNCTVWVWWIECITCNWIHFHSSKNLQDFPCCWTVMICKETCQRRFAGLLWNRTWSVTRDWARRSPLGSKRGSGRNAFGERQRHERFRCSYNCICSDLFVGYFMELITPRILADIHLFCSDQHSKQFHRIQTGWLELSRQWLRPQLQVLARQSCTRQHTSYNQTK